MDIEYLLWLQKFRESTGGALDGFFTLISDIVLSVAIYIVIAMIYWCVNKKVGIMFAMNIALGNFVTQILKNTFCVLRPWIKDARIVPAGDAIETATGYSFPSGHTQVAVSEFGSLAVWQKKSKIIVSICGVMVFLVMLSRNYLGVHTPQDVIASFIITVGVIAMNLFLLSWVEKGKNRDIIFFSVGMAICIGAFLYNVLKPYPMDMSSDGKLLVDSSEMIIEGGVGIGCATGFLLGCFIDRRFVKYEVPNTLKRKIWVFLVGAVLTVITVFFVCDPIKDSMETMGATLGCLGEALYFIIAFLVIMAIYPAAVKATLNAIDKKNKTV